MTDKKTKRSLIRSKSFDLGEKIKLPESLTVHFLGKILVIAPEQANWIVLDNKRDYELFCRLKKGNNIKKCLKAIACLYGNEEAENVLTRVLTELEFKRFYLGARTTKDLPSTNLILYLTNRCNLRCKHCYMKSGKRLKNELSTGEWINIINQFCEARLGKYITFSGGEVLLRDDFFYILDHAYNCGLQIQMFSNGTLLNDKKINKIIDKVYEIQLSLDGPTPQSNDVIRGKGTFNIILKNLRLLMTKAKNKNVRICIGITPTLDTIKYFNDGVSDFFKELFEEFGKKLIIRIATDLFEGRNVCDLTLDEKKFFRTTVTKIYDEMYEEDFFLKLSTTVYIPNRLKRNCGFSSGIKIFPNGDCYPCDLASFAKVGNTRKDSLVNLKENLYNIYEETTVEKSHICKNCDLKYFCGGSCKINNYRRHNDPLIPYCDDSTKLSLYEGLINMNKYYYDLVD